MINYYETVRKHPQIFHQLSYRELLFAKYDCPMDDRLSQKWWEHTYFIYIRTGKEIIHTSENSWTLQAGDSALIKRGACLMEKFFDETLCIMSFFVPNSFLRPFLRENLQLLQSDTPPPSNDLIIPLEKNNMMEAFYDSMAQYFNSEIHPPEQLLELKFRELLFNVISNRANKDLHAYLKTLLTDHDNLQEVMEANCLFNLKLEDYAKLCNRSLSSFKRDFHKAYQMPPGQWLHEKRIEHAKHLLIATDKSINDIAFECAFEDSTHFIRMFGEYAGASPLQFRKNAAATFHK